MFNSKACAAGVLALALTGAAQADTNYVNDGTFAGGATSGGFTTYFGGGTFDGAWTVGGNSIDLIGTYWQQPNGGYSVDMDGNAAGSISQTLNLAAAGAYKLTFLFAGNMGGDATTKEVDVSVGSVTGEKYFFDTTGHSFGDMGYTLETLYFTATGPTTLTFASGTPGASGGVIADVSVTAVPEPASIGMLLAAIGMFGVMSSRRRAR